MRGFKFLTKDYNPPTTRGARGKREGGGRVGVPSFTWAPKISQLPKNPGVYCFKKSREILYIGKATNIRERVKNHFQRPTTLWERLTLLRQGFGGQGKIGYLKTDSEITALILEANLIKKYQPKYNVVWRDDKNYFFVGVTKEEFPKIFITHQPKIQNTEYKIQNTQYVGPFVDGKSLKKTLDVLRKIFPYRTCKTLPKRPCLWYQLGRCPAPCLLKSSLEKQLDRFTKSINWGKEYRRNIQNLIKILQGRKHQVLINLRKEMKGASKLQDFEKAAKIRDQIESLEKVLFHAKIFEELVKPEISSEHQKAEEELKKLIKKNGKISRIEAYDISNIQGQEAAGSMVTFIDGKPEKSQYRRFKIRGKFTPYRNEVSGAGPNDIAMLKECLTRRLKHPEWPYPDLILIDGGRGQLNAARSVVKYEIQNTKYKIQTMALAKKENKLFIENQKEPTLLKSLPREIFNLILQLRDEAHRFAISYHRKLRKRGLLEN